ncbi:MAG: hypothetical protein ACPGWR_21075 [Ardenticatenaceae bacterium]
MSPKQSEKKLPIEHRPKEMLVILLKRLGGFFAVVLGNIVLFVVLLLIAEYPIQSLALTISLVLLVFIVSIYLKINQTQQQAQVIQRDLVEINKKIDTVFQKIAQISDRSSFPTEKIQQQMTEANEMILEIRPKLK